MYVCYFVRRESITDRMFIHTYLHNNDNNVIKREKSICEFNYFTLYVIKR